MSENAMTSWSLPGVALLAGLGGWLGWQGLGPTRPLFLFLSLTVLAASVLLLITTAVWRRHHDVLQHKVDRYGCPRCHYFPSIEAMRNGESTQCPRCGRVQYH